MAQIFIIGHLVFLATGSAGVIIAMLFHDMPVAHGFVLFAVLYFLFHIAMNTESS